MTDIGFKKFTERLETVCGGYANKTAITYMRNDDSKTFFSYGEIIKSINAAKEHFTRIGLRPGDRVAIITPHSPYAVIAGLSLAFSNITSVLIDAALPYKEINRLLELSDVRAVFTNYEVYGTFDKVFIANIPVFIVNSITDTLMVFNDSLATVSRDMTSDPHFDVMAILFSSGTTASAKGVMITYCAFLESVRLFMIPSKISDKSSLLYVLPFHHIAGFTGGLTCLFTGGDVGMIEDVTASKLQKGLAEYQPSIFSMVPRVYDVMAQKMKDVVREKGMITDGAVRSLLALSGFSRKYLGVNLGKYLFADVNRKVFGKNFWGLGTGATLCRVETTRFFLNLGFEWANFYAMTETNVPVVSTGVFDRYPIKGVGRVDRYDGISIKIQKPDENGVGEIRVKTVLIMKGYFRDPELTANAFDEDGYFKTGDLGYIDKKGYLYIAGRIKETIILHTGKKVAPTDVDALYGKFCPDILIASCGVQNKSKVYDDIHLFIEKGKLSPDKQQELQKSIMEFSAQSGTLYQISKVHFIDKLPTTSVGKVKRFQLQEIALS